MAFKDASYHVFMENSKGKKLEEKTPTEDKLSVGKLEETLKKKVLTAENISYFIFGAGLFLFSFFWIVSFGPSITEKIMKTDNQLLNIWLSPFLYFIICCSAYFLFVRKFKTQGQGPAIFFFFIFGLLIAGTTHYNQSSTLKKQEDVEKMMLGQMYYSQSQQITPRPAGLMSTAERQELIAELSRKVSLLDRARQYTGRYESEYREALERLEMERNVLEMIAERGEPGFATVNKQGELISAGTIPKVSRIRYFSLHNFKIYFSDDDVETWKEAKTSEGRVKVWDNKEMNIKFELASLPTEIYYWVEKL